MTIALVTGATRGLGKAVAIRLARSGKTVVIVARDPNRGATAAAEIHRAAGEGRVKLLVADLARMSDVRRLAEEVRGQYPDLDVLINNAGVSKFTREVTPDGLETTFATNHMAPFLLSTALLDVLSSNHAARIVNITSEQHRFVRSIPWDDLQAARRFRPIEQYSLTKLYNILFTRELTRRSEARGVIVTCVSPGFLRTDLGREARGSFRLFLMLARPFQQAAAAGADAVMHALDAGDSGAYFRGMKEAAPSKLAQDETSAARLWEISRELARRAVD
jgi:NAD(P)-dependent dehydrogenase (short-subunit alcohol dehydrogenase family)